MEAVFLKILNMSISALWVVLGVLVVRLVLQKAPKWMRILLWSAVGLRLVLPVIPVSDLSLIPSAETVPPDIVYAARPAIHSGVSVINAVVNPVLGTSLAATPQYSMNPVQKLLVVGVFVWVLGMVAMALYAFISWLRIRLRVRESVEETGVWLCDRIPSPFILGIFRPRIYLPSDLGGEDMDYVLAHERAHLKRKDHWWKPLGFALLTVHWFNPALWLAYILLCRDIELACDERVMKSLGEEAKKPYAEALIHCAVPRSMLAACPLAFGENSVKGRLKAILNYKKPAFWLIAVAVVACIVVGVCFLTDPAQQPESPAATVQQDHTKPPVLWVSGGSEDSVQAARLGYDWSWQENGQTAHVIADSSRPTAAVNLPFLELSPIAYSHRQGNTVLLTFEKLPDRITVTCYAPEGEQVLQTDGVQAFDILEGTYIYGIQAEWEDRGKCEYAFRGSFNMPKFGYIPSEVAVLRAKYPQYFDLPTYQGLDVYIWQMAAGSYSCGLLRGKTTAHTKQEIQSLVRIPPLSMQEMRLVLSTYNLDRSQIRIHPITMLHSSYGYTIDEAYRTRVKKLFWGLDDWGVSMDMVFTSGTAFRVNLSAETPPDGVLFTGSAYSVVKYAEDGTVEKLASKPDVAWDLAAYIIPKEKALTQTGDLQFVYGELPPGTYQLQKIVTCQFSGGGEEKRIYTCDFAITD